MRYLALALPLLVKSAFALEEINLDPKGELVLNLGLNEMNRLSLDGDRIVEIFTLSETMGIETDERLGFAILTPFEESSTKLIITTEKGKVQDIVARVSKNAGRSFLLKEPTSEPNQDATLVASYFVRGKVPHGFKYDEENHHYTNGQFVVLKQIFHNQTGETVELQESEFFDRNNIKAIAINNRRVLPGQMAQIFKVI